MREILFRGKRTDNGEWVYGLLGRYNTDYECANIIDKFECLVPVKTETVGQYTGLNDKNGKRIFEGDIVEGVAYSTDFIGVIVWIDEIAGFGVRYFNSRRIPTAWENSSILKMIQRGHKDEFAAEVIGNVTDNPELLKGE